jgi:hypothetical protein
MKKPKLGDYMEVNGEPIPKQQAMELIRMLCNDAKQLAGDFHGQNRSEKFRANWPSEYAYAECNWRGFVDAIRAGYAALLGEERVPEHDKRRMFLAIALWDQVAKQSPNFEGLRLAPNTQQFVGDPYENRKIKEDYGKHSNTFKELLMPRSRFN